VRLEVIASSYRAHVRSEHFNAIAPRYDALRGQLFEPVLDLLVREADLAGRRVLDLGCGTGRFAAALADRHGCTAVGVDPSPAMLAEARKRKGAITWLEGRAEAIPLEDGAVQRAFLQTVVHLIEDRPAACAELRRVVEPDGIVAILTIDPAGARRFWMADLMPSWAAIDEARCPEPDVLVDELAAAGFASAGWTPRPMRLRYTREEAAHLLRERFASSLSLIDDAELEAGARRAERDLPPVIEPLLEFVLVLAR
jgi:ubiquinone/menaquinone biosynthesis C-methylase UbiE